MDLDSAVPLEVFSVADLARWLISSNSNQHGILYLVNYKGKFILCSMTSFSGYYNFAGLPLLLFTYLDSEPTGSFLRFDIRADEQQIKYSQGFVEGESTLGFIHYLPIIKLKTIPSIFNFEN